jgi:hypothetical protein
MEIMVHNVGFIPHREQIATHARYRYRLRKKGSHPASQEIEHNLWLIHYKQTDPQNRIHTAQLQLHQQHQQMLHDRMVLQSQGAIPRKDFMLLDRAAWPQIALPVQARRGSSANGPYPGQPSFAMVQPPGFYSGHVAHPGPPAKRARQAGPNQMHPGMRPHMQLHEFEVEEAEDSLIADWLDNMTPTAISTERFKRNHVWLEEVFSSIHSISHILPEDLGLGLAGELADLTKGVLSAQVEDTDYQRRGRPDNMLGSIDQNAVYHRLGPEKLAVLEQRVNDYINRKEDEMDKMRELHTKRLARLNQGKFYLEADDQLREAGIDETRMDEVAREVEAKMHIKVQEGQELACAQQGMLEDDGKELNGDDSNDETGLPSDDAAAGLLDEFTSNVEFTNTDAQLTSVDEVAVAAVPSTNNNLHIMQNMDIDIQLETQKASVHEIETAKAEDEWVVVDNREQTTSMEQQASRKHTESPEATKQHTADDVDAQQHSTEANDVLQPESMFEGAEFEPFENMDAGYEGGDSLLNFGGGFGGDSSGTIGDGS